MLGSPYYSRIGVVASEHPIASHVGAKILEEGGNAVDAAVAISFTLSVTLPHLGGIGGDFFAILMDENGKVRFFNGSGFAPRRLTIDEMLKKNYTEMPKNGPLSITVPGQVDGLRIMHKKLGSLEWSILLRHPIEIAENGFGITKSFLDAIHNSKSVLSGDRGSEKIYLRYERAEYGQKVRFPELAKALKEISEDPRAFYEGQIAEEICKYLQSVGGVLDEDDLRSLTAYEDRPLHIKYRDVEVFEMPPNTQGITTLHMLKMLEEKDLAGIAPLSRERLTLFLDVFRKAYWARENYVTDPRYMEVNPEELLTEDFLSKLKQYETPRTIGGDGDTTYFAVIDDEGRILSGIQSLFYPFGSGITEPTYGITFNARASSFSLDPSHVNRLAPGKRPMHTLSAIIAETHDRVLAIGLSGGHFRPQLHVEIFTNIFDYGMDPQEALDSPRFIWIPGTQRIETESEKYGTSIPSYEITLRRYPYRLGVAAIAEMRKGQIKGGYCDIRGDGLPIGII